MLDRVTFTGADDRTDPQALCDISREFPIVEWGILFSRAHAGSPRYPSMTWLDRFMRVVIKNPQMRISAHLCGAYVREFAMHGDYRWVLEIEHSHLFQRVQLNFHAEFHRIVPGFGSMLHRMPSTQFILQCDGVNDRTVAAYAEARVVVPLFDTSGGAGILPREWPVHWPHVYCGYAGGLGPHNIATEFPKIDLQSPGSPYWIDMERRVRSVDDLDFELDKVREVLQKIDLTKAGAVAQPTQP